MTSGGGYIKLGGGNIDIHAPGMVSIKCAKLVIEGPVSLTQEMPVLPQSAIPERELLFDLRLADSPGPTGHPLAHTPWRIVISHDIPEAAMLADDAESEFIILSGNSDAEGKLPLDAAQQALLAQAYCHHPGSTWLLYPGQAVKINVAQDDPSWSQDEKLLQSMSAADFSERVHDHPYSTGLSNEVRYAKKALDAANKLALLPKLKR